MICYFCKESTETIEFTINQLTNYVCQYCYFKYVEGEE